MTSSPVELHVTYPLPLLAAPDSYVACGLDLRANDPMRDYWLGLFRRHFPSLLHEATKEADARGERLVEVQERYDACAHYFYGYLDSLEAQPSLSDRLDILTICQERERILRRFGIEDAYRLTKQRETNAAAALLPAVLTELDRLDPASRNVRIIEGIFAGNIFDLGVTATVELFRSGSVDFHGTRQKLKPRPWLFDDLDAWLNRIRFGPVHRCALLFVDNAGCDIVLGMIPFARDLLSRGTGVILAANDTPSLNDVTYEELKSLIGSVAQHDPVIAQAWGEGSLEVVPSGNGTPLIDLSVCSSQLVDATRRRGVDLVVLEGMGRALESNFEARFACDCLKIAMIKDEGVAHMVHGTLFDLVMRFEPSPTVPPDTAMTPA